MCNRARFRGQPETLIEQFGADWAADLTDEHVLVNPPFTRFTRALLTFVRAARIIRGTQSGSASKLSRYLLIEYDEAVGILDLFSLLGVVEKADEFGFRKVRWSLTVRIKLLIISLGFSTQRQNRTRD